MGCLLIPMLLNYIFLFITWKVTTKHGRWSWYWWVDLVTLALQIWPQYRVGRIIWYRLKHDLVFEEEEKMYNEEICGKEKVLENLPQVIVKIGIFATAWLPRKSASKSDFLILFADIEILFFASLILSICSSIFTVSSFFLEGRFKFLQRSTKFCKFFSLSFFITISTIALSFFYKVWVLGALLFSSQRVFDMLSVYNPPVSDVIGHDYNSSCKSISIVEKYPDSDYIVRNLLLSNQTASLADSATAYSFNGTILMYQRFNKKWVTSTEDCLVFGETCAPAFKEDFKVYCGDSMDIISVANWTVIILWYVLMQVPQFVIMFSCLAWTEMLPIIYLFPELILATITSNFTFGPVRGNRKGKLVLHDRLTWLSIVVSISGLIVSIVILELSYRDGHSVYSQTVLNFWLQGWHEQSGEIGLPIPPVYPLLAALLSACLTAMLCNMNQVLPSKRFSPLSLKRSVYEVRNELGHGDKPYRVTCSEKRLY